jgi:hypothetical protein
MIILLQFCFLERLLFCPSLGCYRWTKGAGGKLTQNGRFSWIKPPWFYLQRCYAADCGSRWLILASVSLIAGFTLYVSIYWLHGSVNGDVSLF